ncbi:MAG TPA: 2-C-methyl-D-erythritol 2,4-cyclodiphosphate synthase [Acidobacteriota bacterium]|nr:2-C-methyl-D-erythritol 2,4-cyclodiphosphate synthase [Acidobacteriota bacterium]
MNIRVGHGYDIHPLGKGRRLLLAGVEIEHEFGLGGHSDADVIAHAVIDALLGAAGLGDIGTLFPDTDPQYEDADSIGLLRDVGKRLRDEAWKIGNVDVTVIAERPKLAQHIPAMRENVSSALQIGEAQVSIKAKTNEGMDATGRQEAIAAHAVAMLHRFLLFREL